MDANQFPSSQEISSDVEQKKIVAAESDRRVKEIIDISIKLGALAALLIACYRILEPFISIMVWAIVLAVSLSPLFNSLKRLFRGRGTLSAVVITVLFLSVLITPIVWMSISTGMSLERVGQQIKSGDIKVPAPSEKVLSVPVVGKPVYDAWSLASTNISQLVVQYKEQLMIAGTKLLALLASIGKGMLLLAAAIIVSGILLAFGTSAGRFGQSVFVRLAGERGKEMFSVAEVTVRNVTKGILGVAFIQAMIAGAGMFIAGIPFAGLWTLICLFLAVMQIGMLPVSLGVIIYAWTSLSTGMAIFITVWMAFAGIIDNILKPIMLGRKAPVPMLVVFLGAIGGFISSGFIGLFTGAILLSLGYKLLITWVQQNEALEANA